MTPLFEVHSEAEAERALKLQDVKLIGINNRDLATFNVSLETTERIRPMIPDEIAVVTESGIFSAEDVKRLANADVDAILVGEALVTSDDIPAKVRELSNVTFPQRHRDDVSRETLAPSASAGESLQFQERDASPLRGSA